MKLHVPRGAVSCATAASDVKATTPAALKALGGLGVDIIMATGDAAQTAEAVARKLGIHDIHAGVTPEGKAEIIRDLQQRGRRVAMAGDGVNDAPALRQADIGIAMGRRGTQVAADASDIILRDDAFASIVAAIREGRIIYGNIRTFVCYLFSCNLSEILLLSLAVLAGAPLPLLPLQILFLNLVTDVFPALALGFGEGPGDVMRDRPRPRDAPLLARRDWGMIGLIGGVAAAAAFAAFLYAESVDGLDGLTTAFLSVALAQLGLVFVFRAPQESIWRNQITRNPRVWQAIVLSLVIILAGVYWPPAAEALTLSPPTTDGWLLILAGAVAPLLLIEVGRWAARVVAPARSGLRRED